MKFVWVFMYIYIGMPIKNFLYESRGGGGGGVQDNFSRIRILKNFKITDDPKALMNALQSEIKIFHGLWDN